MIFAGIDSHNATHSHTWVFLPSEARWVFSWVLNSALPQLHNRNTLARVRLFVTDQDGQLNFVADNSLGPGSKLPWAIHRLCAWHKLDQNLTNAPRFRGALASREHNDSSMAKWNALVTWLWALVKTPESEWESNVLTTLLDLYLQEGHTKGQLTAEMKDMLRDFIATSFMGNQGKLLGHHYHSVMTCGQSMDQQKRCHLHQYSGCHRGPEQGPMENHSTLLLLRLPHHRYRKPRSFWV
jgi:hypothetical protein